MQQHRPVRTNTDSTQPGGSCRPGKLKHSFSPFSHSHSPSSSSPTLTRTRYRPGSSVPTSSCCPGKIQLSCGRAGGQNSSWGVSSSSLAQFQSCELSWVYVPLLRWDLHPLQRAQTSCPLPGSAVPRGLRAPNTTWSVSHKQENEGKGSQLIPSSNSTCFLCASVQESLIALKEKRKPNHFGFSPFASRGSGVMLKG